jgi:hypothetical protein
MPLPRLTVLSAMLLTSCAANTPATRAESAPAPSAPAKSEPRTIREALARERTEPLPRKSVESAEGVHFRGTVPTAGALELMQHPNGSTLLRVPIGTSVPITCLFYPKPVDAGAAARNLFESIMEGFTVQKVRATAVKAYAGSPALYLEGEFTQGTGEAAKVGVIKVMVHADPALPKTCFHDELGYTRTFLDVTGSIATGLTSTAPEQPVAPYYSDVQVLRVGELPLGFQYTTLFGANTGGSILEVSTTLVSPGAPAQLVYVDSTTVEQADTAGVLVSKSYAKRVNTTTSAKVSLRRQEDGSYNVEGQVDGKDTQARLTGELIGAVGLAARLREGLLKGQGAALEAMLWVPPADASAPTKVVVRPRAEAGARAATMELGPMSLKMELDAHGFPQWTEMASGSATVIQERLSQTGEP